MQIIVWSVLILLTLLHQVKWDWPADALVGGVVPGALAYHAGLSIAAAAVWLLAIQFAWPVDAESREEE